MNHRFLFFFLFPLFRNYSIFHIYSILRIRYEGIKRRFDSQRDNNEGNESEQGERFFSILYFRYKYPLKLTFINDNNTNRGRAIRADMQSRDEIYTCLAYFN